MKKYLTFIWTLLLVVSFLVQPAFALDLPTVPGENQDIAADNNNIQISVKNFGASGSNLTTNGSIAVSSNILALASPIDFKNGQGIVIANAGPSPTIPAPATLTVTPTIATPTGMTVNTSGTTGSTGYSYTVIAVDANGGCTAAPAAVQTTSGNATLSSSNYNVLSVTAFPGAVKYEWYRTASGGTLSSTGYIGETTDTTLNDTGLAVATPPTGIPSSPPASAAGTTTYTYAVAAMDNNGAMTSSVSASTSSGWATLSNMNYNSLTTSWDTNVSQYVWYRTVSGGTQSSTGFVAVDPICDMIYHDWGWVAGNPPYSIPNIAPTSSVSGPLFATIQSGGGSNTLTLLANASSTATSALIQHNDSTALQTAFNQGGNIYIPTGTYNVFKTLMINYSDTSIYGAGIDKTIFSNMVTVPANYFNGPLTISSVNSSKITGIFIYDITFNGNYYADNSEDGVRLSNVDDSSIYNCKTINSVGSCLGVFSMQWGVNGGGLITHYDYLGLKSVHDCIAYNCSGEVFDVNYSANVSVTNNAANDLFLFNWGGHGGAWLDTICVEGCINAIVANNSIKDIPASPTGFSNGGCFGLDAVYSQNINVSNNIFENPTSASGLVDFDTGGPDQPSNVDVNIFINGNRFINNGGVYISIDNGYAGNIQITNNVVENGTLAVISDVGATTGHINISNNIIDEIFQTGCGIDVGDGGGNTAMGNDVTIYDNTINASGITPARYDNPALFVSYQNDVTVNGNIINSCPNMGIWLLGLSNFAVKSNIVNHNGAAIAIYLNSCNKGTVSDNIVNNCPSYACLINNSSTITVSANKFDNNQGSFAVVGTASNMIIVNNDFSGCSWTYPVDGSNEIISGNIGYDP